jgi:hypothetical protein
LTLLVQEICCQVSVSSMRATPVGVPGTVQMTLVLVGLLVPSVLRALTR